MMAEGIEQPADLDLDAQGVAAEAFGVENLADEGLAAGHVIVGHDVQPADDLQAAFSDELPKGGSRFRIAFEGKV